LRPLKHSALFLFLLPLFYVHCDTSIPQAVTSNQSSILSIDVTPSFVQFTLQDDGYKDTTLTFEIQTEISVLGSSEISDYVVKKSSTKETVASGTLANTEDNFYIASFDLNTSTTQIQDYIVQVSVYDEYGNFNSAEYNIELIGFSNARPQILMVENPLEVNRPESGQFNTLFTAKVTDQDGQETIDRVLVRIIDVFGDELPSSPYQMFDDGTTYNDTFANDSVFTITFPIQANSERTTESYNIEYYAIDQGGIHSDTTTTTFKITNNQ
jgi:hypothetical protein